MPDELKIDTVEIEQPVDQISKGKIIEEIPTDSIAPVEVPQDEIPGIGGLMQNVLRQRPGGAHASGTFTIGTGSSTPRIDTPFVPSYFFFICGISSLWSTSVGFGDLNNQFCIENIVTWQNHGHFTEPFHLRTGAAGGNDLSVTSWTMDQSGVDIGVTNSTGSTVTVGYIAFR